MFDQILQVLPLWVAALLLVGICGLARAAGELIFRILKKRSPESDAGDDKVASYVIAAIFGLLAFVMGISFSIALDRFDTRRGLVAEEATAIEAVYLRASLFDAPHRSALQTTLRQYAVTRIAPAGLWDERMEEQQKLSRSLRTRLWDQTYAAVYPVRETELASYFLESMNEALRVGTRRELSGQSYIPSRIVGILILYTVISAGVLGFLLGDRPGLKREATTVLFLLIAIMFVLILDIDRPRAGAIQVPQRALQELVQNLDRDAARSPGAPRSPLG